MTTIKEAEEQARKRAASQLFKRTGGAASTELTIRDQFAIGAITPMITMLCASDVDKAMNGEDFAKAAAIGAYTMADAMLKERKNI